MKFPKSYKGLYQEVKARFKSTSPYLFRIIQRLSIAAAFFAGLVIALKATGIALPEPFASIGDKAVIISAGLTYIVSKLPVDTDKASQATLDKIKNNEPE